MSNQKENMVVPKLRFSEFKDAEDWKKKTYDEIGTFTGGGTPSRVNQAFWEGNIPWISSSDIDEDSIFQLVISRFITEEALKDSATKKVPPNSILLVSRVGVGKLAVSRESICTSQDFTNFTPKEDDLIFLAYLLKSQKKILLGFSQGMAIKGFTKEDISKLKALIPAKKEQQKIAACLSSLDELVTAESKKLDQLRAHKKGLMQQLFPAEGETVPKLQFSNEGSWMVASLPEVVFFQEGPGIMAVDFRNEGVPLIRLAGIGATSVTLEGCNYLDTEKVAQKWAHFRLETNDLIISTSATFGLTSIVTEGVAGAVFYTGLIRFRSINKTLDSGYLKAFLASPQFGRQATSAAVGGGIKHFGPTHLKQMEISLPPLVEQEKIANCLSYLDELIAAQAEKIETLKLHKKSLMQQLFPQTE
jgi:type I restriction enzyme, S subunit